ncbi:putative DEAD-box ATP-dependent RNA helicase 33 [Senna tora]|uniref:Putative DEAD-box ATP-dependent RNA helicase 33 n=1 Tax=Senna tora TaxID=362788 RepID=A0A834XI88_9FABA|nr:putative DEAD-box ATP-dependent RNA helicase 33 [Senna tora]
MNLLIPNLPQQLNFSGSLTSPGCLSLHEKLSHLSLSQSAIVTPKRTVIRMGGGPRTYPGGVSKWQWKRMQAKKAKQLLKARLCRERQMYEMRKRAELKAAVSELERPWEVVERAPNLFSVKADEQLKVLADRFQKPGGFDMWTERDGPQLFETPDELPSARFFPKGVVHSIRPYKKISDPDELDSIEEGLESEADKRVFDDQESERTQRSSMRKLRGRSSGEGGTGRGEFSDQENGSYLRSSTKSSVESLNNNGLNGNKINGKLRKRGNRRKFLSSNLDASNGYRRRVESGRKHRGQNPIPYSRNHDYNRGNSRYSSSEPKDIDSEVYDMSLQQDGSYGFMQ